MAWQFVAEVAKLQLGALQKVRIIMGNESCDLDSAASALAYGYLQNCMANRNPNIGTVIPILNIPQEDFILKTEVCYYLKKCGVPLGNLFFRDTINFDLLMSSSELGIVLVDHHALSDKDTSLKPYVIEVIDHRPLDPDWQWENVKKTMETVGSCATLVAELLITQNEFPVPEEVLMLLYGTIILDTACLSDNPKKFTAKDVSVLEEMEKRLVNKPGRGTLYSELLSVRCDITELSISQLLRKDLKVVSNIPVSSLPLLVQDFLSMSDAEEEVERFAESHQYKAVVILGVSKLGNELKREIAIFSQERSLLKVLTDSLTKSKTPNLQLQPIKNFSDSGKVVLFRQLNKDASRKQIVPLVKQAVINYERTHSPGCSSTRS
ncbi:exopolyphosphatase PRUNE1-like isoform X1 [Schistocerca piceifrons]|uniref:exopolyphosphatase PRUNE1-like isoform X1 n=1 Tax=Schistocerca piceifrons TaxID=274613 RepID=UPI001F5EDF24|nr:exopolyphosphatase PRUNE1-like isoform X1 [Schistocerca piceifrons]